MSATLPPPLPTAKVHLLVDNSFVSSLCAAMEVAAKDLQIETLQAKLREQTEAQQAAAARVARVRYHPRFR